MDMLTEALEINLRVEATRRAGYEVILPHQGNHVHVETPDGPLVFSGETASTIIASADALWGFAGVISRRSALLYFVSDHLPAAPRIH